MSAYDDLLQEAADAGVQSDWIDRLRAATEGSPLRQEIKTLKAQNGELSEQVGKFRQSTIGSTLKSLGFTGNPAALNLPEDLDPLDPQKVTEWAVENQLVAPPAPSDEEQQRQAELDGHQRIDDASAGASGLPVGSNEAREKALTATSEADFWKHAREAGLVRNPNT